jgi:beta-phosphoglucomutase-like phosphatase (HAD superfamily)
MEYGSSYDPKKKFFTFSEVPMNFLYVLFFILIGSFSIGHAKTAQISDVMEIFSQTTDKSQCMHIKAIIFDCDGTLIDNGIEYFLGWEHALKCQGYELNAEKFWDFMNKNMLAGAPGVDDVIVKYCCDLLGRECANEIVKDKNAFLAKLHKTYEFPAIEPTVNFLHALGKEKEDLGLKLGLASANTKENILRVLKRLNVDHYFDVIVSGEDLTDYSDPQGTNKPKPYIYLHASKLLGMHPAQCVAIEDSRTGISSAVNAGCIAIAIPNAYTAQQDLSHAHLKLISFVDMTPTDFLQIITNLKMSMQSIN